MIALVHDLAEAQGMHRFFLPCPLSSAGAINTVGDIAPRENIPKAEKQKLEAVCNSS